MLHRCRIPLLAIATVVTAAPVHTQAPREVPLGRATATYPAEFSMLRGIRELSDGSVLAVDPIDNVLLRINRGLTASDTVGRRGAGPGEYVQPDGIWPLPADSSLLTDLGNNRLSAMDRAGRFSATRPIASDGGQAGLSLMLVGGIDRAGRFYFRGGAGGGDSIPLFRFDRATNATTRIGTLKAPATHTDESGDANNRRQSSFPIPLSPADGWAVAPSGTIFLVRSGDYHVDVIPATGARRNGPAVRYTPVPITQAEKDAWAAANNRDGGLRVSAENRNGQLSFGLSRARGNNDRPTSLPWPRVKPPFDPAGIYIDARERVWVKREQAANSAPLYDVFNDQGVLVGSVRMPAGRRVIGMGNGVVYVVHIDEDDLYHLERYALPL